jgi:hypothetical protein
VTIDNPPINMYDPRMFAAFNQLMDRLVDADELRVVVFDDLEDEEVPDVPGAAEFTHWPAALGRSRSWQAQTTPTQRRPRSTGGW